MRYKNDNDNRYRVRFMRATEELMDKLTVKEFINYLEENAEFEDEDTMYLDGRITNTKVYCLWETATLRKEFAITEDGRVFYLLSLIKKIELIDREENKEENKEEVKEEKQMKLLNMEKVVTVLHTGYIPYMRKYKELEEELEKDEYIEVEFPKGMYKKRMKQLTELGYNLVSWSWEPAEDAPLWYQYRGYFRRA